MPLSSVFNQTISTGMAVTGVPRRALWCRGRSLDAPVADGVTTGQATFGQACKFCPLLRVNLPVVEQTLRTERLLASCDSSRSVTQSRCRQVTPGDPRQPQVIPCDRRQPQANPGDRTAPSAATASK